MLGFILFAAMLHIVLGYGLAIYLGYAPVTQAGTSGNVSAAPSQFVSLIDDEDIVIADDETADETTDKTVEKSIDLPVFAESESDGSQSALDATVDLAAVAPPTTAEMAESQDADARSPAADAPSEEAFCVAVDDLFGLSQRIKKFLIECADPISSSNDTDSTGSREPVLVLASAPRAIGQELAMVAPLVPSSDSLALRITASWEQFNQQMTAYLDSTGANQSDPSDGVEACRDPWLSAMEATFTLQDAVAGLRFELAQRETSITHGDEKTLVDEETELLSASGIAMEYDALQRSSTDDDKLVVALLDIDHCRRLNKSLGPIVCGELIVRVAELVRATLGDAGRVGRLSGQRFAVLLPGFLPNAATDEIERIRETLRATTFRADGVDHHASMTCGLAEAASKEPAGKLMKRLEETLAEAKRYGRDRTFLHEGDFPAPVIPPKIDVDRQTIELATAGIP